MDIDKILDEYRKGDEGRRLALFLAFRDLRDHFGSIEQENPDDDFAIVRFPWSRKHHVDHAA